MALPDDIEKDLTRIHDCLAKLGAFDSYKAEVDRANELSNLAGKIKHLQEQETLRLTVKTGDGDLDVRIARTKAFGEMIESLQSELTEREATMAEMGTPAHDLMTKLTAVNQRIGELRSVQTVSMAKTDLAAAIKRVETVEIPNMAELWKAIDAAIK